MTLNHITKTAADSKKIIKIFRNASKKALGSGLTLTNNEINDIMKVIKSLENRGILWKITATKITSQEVGFFKFS